MIAGNGTAGFSGMGGAAVSAALDRPEGLAKIGSILYIADTGANRVLEVDPAAANRAPTINVVAGNGAMAGATPGGGPALATAIGPDVLGLAPGPHRTLLIATANEILALRASTLSVVLSGGSTVGVDPRAADVSQCDPSGVAMGGGGDLYFVCADEHGLFERHAGGVLGYLGFFRSYGYGLLSASPNGTVLGATGDVVSIAHGTLSVVETFSTTIANVGAFQAEYVAESPTGTFAADQSGGDGIGPPAIVTFTPRARPLVLWPT